MTIIILQVENLDAALDLAYVASGRFDAYFQKDLIFGICCW